MKQIVKLTESDIHNITNRVINKLLSEIRWSDHKKLDKPIFVRLKYDTSGAHDVYFASAEEAADYCYQIGLENVFDVGAIIFGKPTLYNYSHLDRYVDKTKEREERIKNLDKILKRWKRGLLESINDTWYKR